MPTTKEQLETIDKRLEKVESALGLRPAPKGWFALRWDRFINNKGTAVILAVILCVASIYGKYYLDHKNDDFNRSVDQELQKPGGVAETLAGVQKTVNGLGTTLKTLQPFIQDVIGHQFESAAKLPTAELRERLPAVNHLLTVASNQHVKVEPKILGALSGNLKDVQPESRDFWPTVAALISYRSRLGAREFVVPNFPDCTEAAPVARSLTPVPTPGTYTIKHTPAIYHDCSIVLDSDAASLALSQNLSWTDITFRNCVIIYNGGILALHGKIVGRIRFEDCFFLFSIEGSPPPSGQSLAQAVLSGGKTIEFSPS